MKNRQILAAAMILLLSASFLGCATSSGTYDPARSTAAGAAGGAVTGAAIGSIIGAATGSPATGAWVGAATGAIAGGAAGALYARHQNQQIRNRQAAAQQFNYGSGGGAMVNVSDATMAPATVRPGQTVNMAMTYTILTPDNSPTQVTLVREVRLNGQPVGQPHSVQVTNQNGTFQDRVGFTVPRNAPPGPYTVTSRVMSSLGSGERTSGFTVVQ